MQSTPKVYLHVWTGKPEVASKLAISRYPCADLILVSHRELRGNGWKEQFRALSKLKGQALVLFFESREDNKQPDLLIVLHMLHRCKETIIAYGSGETEVYRWAGLFARMPRIAFGLLADLGVLSGSWIVLRFLMTRIEKDRAELGAKSAADLDIAYIYPFALNRYSAGGAISHIRGVLSGLRKRKAVCEIYTGSKLPFDKYPTFNVEGSKRSFVVGDSLTLSYNWTFTKSVGRQLAGRNPRALYQRHGRFVIAGILLSRRLGVPLILEYNGSEYWMSKYWDPTRFKSWLQMCEDISLRGASQIVVVSEASRQELIERGIPTKRILLNPNGVNPDEFRPCCGGQELRQELGFKRNQVIVGFLGTFSYWHGIPVLQEAVLQILRSQRNEHLRFLLIGEGPLQPEMRAALKEYVDDGRVVFTGLVRHEKVRRNLDAADILVSPHVPTPDGTPFFGSPTKLFEYMAMGKAIIASNLGQLSEVLQHDETAMLVPPGDSESLAEAILMAAGNPEMRARLGRNSRAVAMERFTWEQNAARVLNVANATFDSSASTVSTFLM